MTPFEYTDARVSLGMTNDTIAKWLGVHRSVAYRYANGSSPIPGPVARALRLACGVRNTDRWDVVRNEDTVERTMEETAKAMRVLIQTYNRRGSEE